MATFVSADWVSEHIGRPGYLIIDPRTAMQYLMGHLRGAVSVPLKKLQAPDGRLGPPEQLAAALGEAGLGDDVTPVLYDHRDGRSAAMAAWVLEYLGRGDVHLMDLLLGAWKEQGGRSFTGPSQPSRDTLRWDSTHPYGPPSKMCPVPVPRDSWMPALRRSFAAGRKWTIAPGTFQVP